MTKNHGGKRPGAGRKSGSGQFGEPTVPLRIPVSQKDRILRLLAIPEQPTLTITQGWPSGAGIFFPSIGAPHLPLPQFGHRISAGFPSPADDYIEDRLDLNEYLIHHKEATFFLRVKGHSMTGAGIHDGDMLIVDRSLNADDGKIVIAALEGELTVKRLSLKSGRIALIAENPDYPPIVLKDGQEITIWGVVTSVIHKV
ncbi:LexA family protein [Sulfurirhabdus autotrophica]|uniref:DNA polymerase V n=1 Tax=Sulfurirhabdus autotrophica TaxID=1706046 RepID=A0A4R3XTG2_9PROT|nr:translesion error-prone DNA polymerase V autoproteolytic subunit [Sulfurirhabdus autotrophica]TCV79958.1 DNA polymerase V [Sulfurirhabdus autotrophica]